MTSMNLHTCFRAGVFFHAKSDKKPQGQHDNIVLGATYWRTINRYRLFSVQWYSLLIFVQEMDRV